jgi:hypothetical protein
MKWSEYYWYESPNMWYRRLMLFPNLLIFPFKIFALFAVASWESGIGCAINNLWEALSHNFASGFVDIWNGRYVIEYKDRRYPRYDDGDDSDYAT